MTLQIAAIWEASTASVGAAYNVAPGDLRRPSLGRGPRPQKTLWEPKKVAVYITAWLTQCDCAALARAIGLHRDTVHSHCASIREKMAQDAAFDAQVRLLGGMTGLRVERAPAPASRKHRMAATAEADAAAIEDQVQRARDALHLWAPKGSRNQPFIRHND